MKKLSRVEKTYLAILLIVSLSLRFINLGYSDYIQDDRETFFYWGGDKTPHLTKTQYLLNEHKGPVQLIVGSIPYLIIGNYDNTFAQRFLFALFGVLAVFMLYLMVKKITKSPFIAFVSSYVFSVNGLIVAYSRIAHYQTILFFSTFASIYFFSYLLDNLPQKQALKKSVFGSIFFVIAFYCHWYALFSLIPISYFVIVFLLNKKSDHRFKLILLIYNFLLVLGLILPYFVPFFTNFFVNTRNQAYANSIFGSGLPLWKREDLKQFLVYNPFFTIYIYGFYGLLGIWHSKTRPVFILWFVIVVSFFNFFINYSGLHFYNYFIPLIILSAYGIKYSLLSTSPILKLPTLVVVLFILPFLYLQSYLLFVDHKTEYPTESQKILWLKAKKLSHEDDIRHKTGFPHKRYWPQINEYVNTQNKLRNENFGYHTNEDKGIARNYMDAPVIKDGDTYIIGVKRPYSLANDYKMSQFGPKSTVHEIKNEYGETVVKIYRWEKE